MPRLTTPRLTLRDLDATADAAFLCALLNEPDFLRYIGDRQVRTVEESARYLANGPVLSYARHGFGFYRVSLRENDAPLGICGLVKRETLPLVDLGFAFLAPHRGHGYAFEAASACVVHARRDCGLERLAAITSLDNQASMALLEKLGFEWKSTTQLPPATETLNYFELALT
jgi:[ribosomal protein S5]-alanine N-acetyltransferase